MVGEIKKSGLILMTFLLGKEVPYKYMYMDVIMLMLQMEAHKRALSRDHKERIKSVARCCIRENSHHQAWLLAMSA